MRQSWARVLAITALAAVAGWVAIALALNWYPLTSTRSAPAPPDVTVTVPRPQPGSGPGSMVAVPEIEHMDADGAFLAAYTILAPTLGTDDPAALIRTAHQQCDALAAAGGDINGVSVRLQHRYWGMSMDQTVGLVRAAARAYCPQYADPIG